MKKYSLQASDRTIRGRKVKSLRKNGEIPATVYGRKISSLSVSVDQEAFLSIYRQAGETGLIELSIGAGVHPVLVHHVQRHPVTGSVLHAEFFSVDLKEKVSASIPVELNGESPAVAEKAGVLLQVTNTVDVLALPADLPDKIAVDVSSLKSVDDEIKVGDLTLPAAVSVQSDPTLLLVRVAPLVSKEAEAQAEAEAQQKAESEAAATGGESGAPADAAQSDGNSQKNDETA